MDRQARKCSSVVTGTTLYPSAPTHGHVPDRRLTTERPLGSARRRMLTLSALRALRAQGLILPEPDGSGVTLEPCPRRRGSGQYQERGRRRPVRVRCLGRRLLLHLRGGGLRRLASATGPRVQGGHRRRWLTVLGLGDPSEVGQYLPPCPEASLLCPAGKDRYGRSIALHPEAWEAWRRLCRAAAVAGIRLELVSGFRSVRYQAGIIARKQARGQSLRRIARISALPGYSEHHSGRAVDLHDGHGPALEAHFEASAAYAWLGREAARFGFKLSFPRGNPYGVEFEPWHWLHRGRP